MSHRLKSKELHLFSRLGNYFVFDANTLNLYEVNEEAHAILTEAEGKTPGQVIDILASRFDREAVEDILRQLIDIQLLGFRLPPPEPLPVENVEYFKGITLFVTQDCNLRCRYCLTLKEGHIAPKYMTLETAVKAIDLLFIESGDNENISIGFFGGEPLLNFEVLRGAVEYANQKAPIKKKTIKYTVTTNGTLIDKRMAAFFKEHNITVALSMDGTPEIHDSKRVFRDGSGSFRHVMEGIRHLKEQECFIGAVAVSHDKQYRFKDIVTSLLECGINNVQISNAIARDYGIPFVDEDPDWYDKNYEELVQHLLSQNILFNDPPPIGFPQTFKTLESRKTPYSACSAANAQAMVDPEGRLLPCENFIGCREFEMGSLDEGFDKSWQPEFLKLAASKNETCRACWARNLCGGWCPFFSWSKFRLLDKPVESMCIVKRSYFEVAMATYSLYQQHIRQNAASS